MNNEQILLKMLTESEKSNNTIDEIKQILINEHRQKASVQNKEHAKRQYTSAKGEKSTKGDDRQKNRDQSNFFRNLTENITTEFKVISKYFSGTNVTPDGGINVAGSAVSNVFGGLASSGNVLLSAFGRVGKIATDTALLINNHLKEQRDLFNRVSSSGVTLEGGMSTLRQSAGNAGIGMDRLGEIISKNSQAMIILDNEFGNGADALGKFTTNALNAQNQLGTLGLANEQIVDILLRGSKAQRSITTISEMQKLSENKLNADYIKTMSNMTRVMGRSIDSILSKNEEISKSPDVYAAMVALKQKGFGEEAAQSILSSLTTSMSSVDGGDAIMKLMTSFLTTGSIPKGLEDAGGLVFDFANNLSNILLSGASPEETIKKVQEYVKLNEIEIDNLIADMARVGNRESMEFVNVLKQLHTSTAKSQTEISDNMVFLKNRIDNFVRSSFTAPLESWIGNLEQSLASTALLFLDGNFSEGFSQLGNAAQQAFMLDDFTDVLVSFGNDMGSMIDGIKNTETFQSITNGINTVSDWTSEQFTAIGDFLSGVPIVGDVMSSVSGITESIGNWFDSISDTVDGWFSSLGGAFSKFFGIDDSRERVRKTEEYKQKLRDDAEAKGTEISETDIHLQGEQHRQTLLNKDRERKTNKYYDRTTGAYIKPEDRVNTNSPERSAVTTPAKKANIERVDTESNVTKADSPQREQMNRAAAERESQMISLLSAVLDSLNDSNNNSKLSVEQLQTIAENTIPATNN